MSAVLHEVDDNSDREFVAQLYKQTSETLKKMPDQEVECSPLLLLLCE